MFLKWNIWEPVVFGEEGSEIQFLFQFNFLLWYILCYFPTEDLFIFFLFVLWTILNKFGRGCAFSNVLFPPGYLQQQHGYKDKAFIRRIRGLRRTEKLLYSIRHIRISWLIWHLCSYILNNIWCLTCVLKTSQIGEVAFRVPGYLFLRILQIARMPFLLI